MYAQLAYFHSYFHRNGEIWIIPVFLEVTSLLQTTWDFSIDKMLVSSDKTLNIDVIFCDTDWIFLWFSNFICYGFFFPQVYSALTDDGQIVAVKQIQLDTTNWKLAEADYRLIQREVDIQKTLNHPNIVKWVSC